MTNERRVPEQTDFLRLSYIYWKTIEGDEKQPIEWNCWIFFLKLFYTQQINKSRDIIGIESKHKFRAFFFLIFIPQTSCLFFSLQLHDKQMQTSIEKHAWTEKKRAYFHPLAQTICSTSWFFQSTRCFENNFFFLHYILEQQILF